MKMISWIFAAICRFLCFLFIKFLYAMNWLLVKWGQRFNQTSTAKQTSVHTDEEIRQMRQSINKMEENFDNIIHGCIQSLKLDMKEVEIVLHKLHVDILKYTTTHQSFGTSNVEHQTSTIEATTIPSFQASAPMISPVSPDARSSSGLLSTGASKTDVHSHATPPSAAPIRERSSGTLGSASLPLKGIRAPAKLISAASNTPATYSSVFTKNADVSQLSNPDILAAPSFAQHSPPVSKCEEKDEGSKQPAVTGATTVPTAPAAARSVGADQTPVAVTIKEPAPAEPPSAVTSATQPIKFTIMPAIFIYTSDASAKSSNVTPCTEDVRQAFKACTPAASHHVNCPLAWKIRGDSNEYCKETPITGETTTLTAPATSRSAWGYQTPDSGSKKVPAPAEPLSATTSATQPIKVITSPAEFSFTLDTLAKSSTVTPRNEDVRQSFKPCTPAASHHVNCPLAWKIRGDNNEYCKQIPMTGVTNAPTAPAASCPAWGYQTPGSGSKTVPAPAEPLSDVTSATQSIKVITSPADFSFTSDTLAKSSTVTPRNEDVRQAFKPCTPAASSDHWKWPSIWTNSGQNNEYCKETPITGVTTAPTAPAASCSAWGYHTSGSGSRKVPAPAEPLSATTSATQPIKVITSPAEFSFTLDTLAKSSTVTPRNEDVRQAFKPCTPAASSHHWKWPSIWKNSGQNDGYCKETPITGVTTAPTAPAASRSAWGYQTPGSGSKTVPAPAEPLSDVTSATQPIKVITSPADFSFTSDTHAKSSTVTPRNEDVRQAFKPCTSAASSDHWKWPSIWTNSGQNNEYCKETPITDVTTAPTAPAASCSAWGYHTSGSGSRKVPAPAEPLSATTSATQPIKVITSPAEFSFTLDTLAKSSTVTPRNEDVRQAFKPCTPAASSHHWKWPSIWKNSGQNDGYCKETPITGVTTAPTAPAASRSAWGFQTPGSGTKTVPAPAEPLSDVTSATQPVKVITSPAEFSFTLDTLAKSSTVTPRNEDVRQAFKPCTPAASSHHWKWPSIWTNSGQNNEYCKETPITGVTTAPTAPAASCSAWGYQTPDSWSRKVPAPAEPLSATTSATQPVKVITSPAEFSFTLDTLAKSSTVTPRNEDVRQTFKPCKPAASPPHVKCPSVGKIRGQNDEYCKETPITGVTNAPTAPAASRSVCADQTLQTGTKKESAATVPPSVAVSATRPVKSITSPAKSNSSSDASAKSSIVTRRNQGGRQTFKPCKPVGSSHHVKRPPVRKIRRDNECSKQKSITGVTAAPTAPIAVLNSHADQPPVITKEDPEPSGSSSETMSSGTNAASSTVTPRSPMYSIYLENKELYEYYSNKKKKKKIQGAPTIPATASN